jgi:hypothetical protein
LRWIIGVERDPLVRDGDIDFAVGYESVPLEGLNSRCGDIGIGPLVSYSDLDVIGHSFDAADSPGSFFA